MDSRLVVLKLFLEALDEDGDITTFDGRKRFQKAIYLGQLAGVDLGYRHSWYLRGPYSTALTRDYYSLAQIQPEDLGELKKKTLTQDVLRKLERIKPLFNVPSNVNLNKVDWLELLASWHYLRKISKQTMAEAKSTMQKQKEHLVSYTEFAENILTKHQLI